jgi:hypothetical protein
METLDQLEHRAVLWMLGAYYPSQAVAYSATLCFVLFASNPKIRLGVVCLKIKLSYLEYEEMIVEQLLLSSDLLWPMARVVISVTADRNLHFAART